MNWNRVWIIGNGPSRLTFDCDRLENENVIVLNSGLLRYSLYSASAFFSLDRKFITRYVRAIENFKGEKHLALPSPRPVINGTVWYDWSHKDGLSEIPGVLCTGCNSGYAALGLCYTHMTKEIHLVGYDMDPKDNDQYQFWAKSFRTMIPQLDARGIKVWNHNPNSFIDAFPKIS
jgi:hypothetical protein